MQRLKSCLWIVCVLLMSAVAHAEPAGDVAVGKAVYTRFCVSCHGVEGRGGPMGDRLPVRPRNLADSGYMASRTDQELFDIIKHGGSAVGRSPVMQAFGNDLTDAEIWSTVAYVRTLAAQTARTPRPTPSQSETAASVLRVNHLRLSIWPEYDDPRVLVMFRGEMGPADAFPARVSLPIPKGAEIIGAGMISSQNELLLHPYRLEEDDDRDRLELNLPVPRFFLEFYYDPLGVDPSKQFTYTFVAPYPVERLEVDVQRPLKARDFTTTPPPMQHLADENGFLHFLYVYTDLEPGATQALSIAYTRRDAAPSVAKRQTAAEARAAPRSPLQTTLLALGLLAVVAVLLGSGTFLWTTRKRRRGGAPSLQPSVTPRTGPEASRPEASAPNFCPHCGVQCQPTYRFCAACGHALFVPPSA